MKKRIFVTGTDTDVGKTYVACRIIEQLRTQGVSALGIKPIASGCYHTPDGLRSDDALQLIKANGVDYPYQMINPIAFEPAIAPHIAAAQVGDSQSLEHLQALLRPDIKEQVLIIEGVGGWFVPLNGHQTMADVVKAENLSVILVVAMRLGCLSHALLTAYAIENAGVNLMGWVANSPEAEPMACFDENLASLKARITAPCLGVVAYGGNHLDTDFLMNNVNLMKNYRTSN